MPRPRGRPREFDMEEAMDKAIRVFCEQGYHGTSIPDPINAMEPASGSIYKAFQDMRAVFLAASDRYIFRRKEQIATAAHSSKPARERSIPLGIDRLYA
jgi:TetR/AcrR family transcriptional regulator, transcriptional repressor for nem operon